MADYIERAPIMGALTSSATQAAIRAMSGEEVYIYFLGLVNAAPAADVAPVIRGTWQLLRHDKYSDVYQCSECGRKVSLTHGRGVAEHYPYCHCGARMSEGPAL